MSTPEVKTEREQGLELALQLMGASAAGLAGTTNHLIDNLTAERDELRATLDAIRDTMDSMLDGAFMPSYGALKDALWPSKATVDMYRKAEKS